MGLRKLCSPLSQNRPSPHILDLRGISCPMNWVRIKLVLESVEEGKRIEVLLDEGEPLHNVPRNLKEDGHKLLKVSDEGSYFRLVIQRG